MKDAHPKIFVLGEAMIETWCKISDHQALNSSTKIEHISHFLGGMAVNSALALSSLGCKCELVSSLGSNVPLVLIKPLVDNNVSIVNCLRPETLTALVFAFYNAEGYRHYLFSDELPNHLAFSIQAILDPNAIFLLAGSHYLAFQNLYQNILSEVSKDRIIFSPSYGIYKFELQVLQSIISHCNVMILNRQETNWLCKQYNLDEANIRTLGPDIFVCTQDVDGCTIYTKNGSLVVPAIPSVVINAIGAGDAFNAGFLFGLITGQNIKVCAQLGNGMASLCVTRPETQVISNLPEIVDKCRTCYPDFSFL